MFTNLKVMGIIAKESVTHPTGISIISIDESNKISIERRYEDQDKVSRKSLLSTVASILALITLTFSATWFAGGNKTKEDLFFGLVMMASCGALWGFYARKRKN